MDRAALEKDLQQVQHHIAESERHIARQWKTIQDMERDGHSSDLARELLEVLLQTREAHLKHRDRLIKMVEALDR